MEWNAQRRAYVTDNGEEVSPAQVRQSIDGFIDNSRAEIDQESAKLLAGAITVAAFFAFLSSLITSMHIASSLIAYGGEDEMNNARWGRVDERLSSELAYLEAFKEQVQEAEIVTQSLAEFLANSSGTTDTRAAASAIAEAIQTEGRADIAAAVESALESVGVVVDAPALEPIIDSFGARLESIIWGEAQSRATSYPDAAWGTYERGVKGRETDAGAVGVRRVCLDDAASCDDCPPLATEEYVGMDEIMDIGDSACMGNCRCWFEFSYLNVEPLEIDREIYA